MNDNEQLTFEGMPPVKAPIPMPAYFADMVEALIEFAEAHGVPALPDATFADRLRAKVREVTRG